MSISYDYSSSWRTRGQMSLSLRSAHTPVEIWVPKTLEQKRSLRGQKNNRPRDASDASCDSRVYCRNADQFCRTRNAPLCRGVAELHLKQEYAKRTNCFMWAPCTGICFEWIRTSVTSKRSFNYSEKTRFVRKTSSRATKT
jgi:hypothetical protein